MNTVKQIAEYLAVSETVIYRLIDSGTLKAHRIGVGRGTIRVSDDQLQEYLSSVETKAASDPTLPKLRFRHLSF